MENKTPWLILIYRIPREPSRPRVAVWRKLKVLGALYLQDGAVALPEDAVTREQLEWLQLTIREAGGEATLWEASPNTPAEGKKLVETFRSSRQKAYTDIVSEAGRIRRKAELGGDRVALLDKLRKLEKAFRAERRRDYFGSPMRKEAAAELKKARQAIRMDASAAGESGARSAG
jgi:hypothetical protein